MRFGVVVSLLTVLGAAAALADPKAEEYQKRQGELTRSLAEDYYALGMWCKDEDLRSSACEQFKQVLRLTPDHAGAQRELVKLGDSASRERGPECELRLRNGERVKAELLVDMLRVRTESGLLFIPLARLDLVRFGAHDGQALVVADGFLGKAWVHDETCPAKGKVGLVNVAFRDVESVRVFHPCLVCHGLGTWKCTRCAGAGRVVETKKCPKCDGKGLIKCATCGGRAFLKCESCHGQGFTWGTYAGFRARYRCPACKGTGKVDCPDCEAGGVPCPDCAGKPVETNEIVCPACKGEKTIHCAPCGSTGLKPLPPIDTSDETRGAEGPANK